MNTQNINLSQPEQASLPLAMNPKKFVLWLFHCIYCNDVCRLDERVYRCAVRRDCLCCFHAIAFYHYDCFTFGKQCNHASGLPCSKKG